MAETVNVPDGYMAVVVLLPKEHDGDIDTQLIGCDGDEANAVADAIMALVDFQRDELLAAELAADGEEDEESEDDEEDADEEDKPS